MVLGLATLVVAACSTSKKTTTTASTGIAPAKIAPAKPANGIYAPGNEELTAFQAKGQTATLEQLTEGYTIYTQGACTKCHNPNNIYKYSDADWKSIIEDMAQKAKISDVQKEAVHK